MQGNERPTAPAPSAPVAAANTMAPALVTPAEDAVLVRRAKDGDAQAFGYLYDRYFERVYRYVYYRMRDATEAEDVTSDVFFRALRAMPRYEPRQPFLAWLYRIARNAVIDRVRAKKPRVSFEDALAHPDAADQIVDPDAVILQADRRERLRQAMQNLTGEQQEVVVLRFVEGLSSEEVGTIMGKRAGTVRGLQFRALQALRKHLSAEDLA